MINKKRNNYTLSTEAQSIIDKIKPYKKSSFVSAAISAYHGIISGKTLAINLTQDYVTKKQIIDVEENIKCFKCGCKLTMCAPFWDGMYFCTEHFNEYMDRRI